MFGLGVAPHSGTCFLWKRASHLPSLEEMQSPSPTDRTSTPDYTGVAIRTSLPDVTHVILETQGVQSVLQGVWGWALGTGAVCLV